MQEHNEGKDKYTKSFLPVQLVYFEEYSEQSGAFKREMQIKGWSRVKKEKLINGEWNQSLNK